MFIAGLLATFSMIGGFFVYRFLKDDPYRVKVHFYSSTARFIQKHGGLGLISVIISGLVVYKNFSKNRFDKKLDFYSSAAVFLAKNGNSPF